MNARSFVRGPERRAVARPRHLGLAGLLIGVCVVWAGCRGATQPTVLEGTVSLRFAATVSASDSLEVVTRGGRVTRIHHKARTVTARSGYGEDLSRFADVPGLQVLEYLGMSANPDISIIAYPGRPATAEDLMALERAGGRDAQVFSDTSVSAIFHLSDAVKIEADERFPAYRIWSRVILPNAK